MKRKFVSIVAVLILVLISGCKKDEGPAASKTGLEGTWTIESINGGAPPSGYVSILVFTATQVTITTDLDCREVDNYTVSGDTLTVTVAQVSGTQCGNQVGQQFSARFALAGDRLTLMGGSTRVYKRA
ncbi:MAG: hypothetical protein HY961_03250 [Ignavibacteriae bacterium]|nr:hypothetical protein [Ignavibacteriota bacterium]